MSDRNVRFAGMTAATPQSSATALLERRAAVGSLVLGVLLMGAKFVAFELTGSAAVFSDAMESIVNVLAAGLALYAIWLAHRPADESHPYGHGKVEFISAAVEGGMILLAAGAIVFDAAGHLVWPQEIGRLDTGIYIIAATSVANLFGGWVLISIGRRTGSMTLDADGKHLLSDAGTSLAVVVSMWLVKLTGHAWIDPLVALGAAVVLMRVGIKMVRRATVGLMDEQDQTDHALLVAILDRHVGEGRICSYHKLRHRHVGRHHWVDFHVQVERGMSVADAHALASTIELELEQSLGTPSDAMAHVEPCGGCERCKIQCQP